METPSLVGEVLGGRYRLIRKLGEGGMGEVYAAEHLHIEKRYAIKLLRPEIVSNKEAVKRFYQEARSSSSIGHRNIIAIDDFGELPDGRLYMCMELLEGAALNDLILTLPPVDRLLNILIQTGHGLAAAHAKNIIHRDMKPENIYVTVGPNREDVPKILDFGIAKVSGNDGSNNLTRTGTIFGTPFYMAPEQALGNPVDARTDIYAMGVIMYEVFAGSLPFQGESFMGILTQHITTEPEPVAVRAQKAGRQLPPGLAEVIARCMQKDPAQRFATMDDLVNALVQIYRSFAGAGMSTYMEAFPVLPSAQHPVATPQTGMHQVGGAYSPTMGVGPPPGAAGYGMPSGGHPAPIPQTGPTTAPVAAASASGVYPGASGVVPGKKSSLGLVIAILAVLAVGGGIAAFVVLNNNKKDDSTARANPGSQVASNDKGSDTTAHQGSDGTAQHGSANPVAVDAGTPAVTSDAAETPMAVVDAGATAPIDTPDPAVDAGVIAPKAMTVQLAASNVTAFEIWENGKKILDGPDAIEVPEGATRTVLIKARGFKDKTVVVDTKQRKVKITLSRIPGVVVTPPPTPGCANAILEPKNKACIAQYCRNHASDIRCDAE